MLLVKGICLTEVPHTVVDPGLQIRGGGAGHPDPEIRGGDLQKDLFWALWASFWSKNKGGRPPGHLSYSYDLSCGQLFCKEF